MQNRFTFIKEGYKPASDEVVIDVGFSKGKPVYLVRAQGVDMLVIDGIRKVKASTYFFNREVTNCRLTKQVFTIEDHSLIGL